MLTMTFTTQTAAMLWTWPLHEMLGRVWTQPRGHGYFWREKVLPLVGAREAADHTAAGEIGLPKRNGYRLSLLLKTRNGEDRDQLIKSVRYGLAFRGEIPLTDDVLKLSGMLPDTWDLFQRDRSLDGWWGAQLTKMPEDVVRRYYSDEIQMAYGAYALRADLLQIARVMKKIPEMPPPKKTRRAPPQRWPGETA